jgi:hypothetical protein
VADGPPVVEPGGPRRRLRRLAARWRSGRRRQALDAACLALVAASVVAAGSGLRTEHAAASRRVAIVQAKPRDDGLPVPNRRWAMRAGFAAFARRHIPPDEPVRIVQQAKGVRGAAQRFCRRDVNIFDHFWLVYSLAPRPDTCDLDARWVVYLGVPPGPLPRGAHAYVYRPDLVVVRR